VIARKNINSYHPVSAYLQRAGRKLAQASTIEWISIGLGLAGTAMLSATAGALLAVSLVSTPLMQAKLSPQEAKVFNSGERIASGDSLQLPTLNRPVNILVLGIKVLTSDLDEPPEVDLGYHALVNSFEGLSDTMLLLRFDPRSQKLVALSIPRDTRSWVEGYGMRKINVANDFGGPAMSATSVKDLLGGVEIDRYIRVNIKAVEKLIDALGGVTVYVPYDMEYQDDSQHLYINLKAGKQHLNGERALQFLRFRNNYLGDIGRIQRQQILMRALMDQTINPQIISRLPKIMDVIKSDIDTNLSIEELLALGNFASHTDRSKIQMLLTPGRFSNPKEYKVSYWLPDYHRIDQMMHEHFDFGDRPSQSEEIDPAYLRVAVQDSTEDWIAVDDFINTMYKEGYNNVYISRSWTEPLEVTRIIAQYGDIDSAKAIRRRLGFGEVRVESIGHLDSEVTIQLGRDWLAIKNELLRQSDNW